MQTRQKNIAFITCCTNDWGGSEELWAQTAPILIEQNYSVTIYKEGFNYKHPAIAKARSQGVQFVEFKPQTSWGLLYQKIRKRLTRNSSKRIHYNNEYASQLKKKLLQNAPDLVLINQGINFDGLGHAYECYQLKIPYAIISHKGVDFFWPFETERPFMIEVWQNAQKCFFVSQQNLNLTEEQFGFRFSNAQVIWNPIKFKREILPFPSTENFYKFACIGRFFILDKGQDILLRILSDQSWKDRPIHVTFIGGGPDQKALQDLAEMLNVENVEFAAHRNDVEDLWASFHALILPSRSEGLPLVTLEAMAVGRPVIVSTAGGHAEIIQHGKNGFIADATVKDFAKAMEDAWENRNSWELIGKNANAFVKEKVPALPERIFSDLIIKMIS